MTSQGWSFCIASAPGNEATLRACIASIDREFAGQNNCEIIVIGASLGSDIVCTLPVRSIPFDEEVFSLSLGASRFFDYRLHDGSQPRQRIELRSGTLLIMQGPFQHYWQHQVPKQLKVTDARINLTFRYIHTSPSKN